LGLRVSVSFQQSANVHDVARVEITIVGRHDSSPVTSAGFDPGRKAELAVRLTML